MGSHPSAKVYSAISIALAVKVMTLKHRRFNIIDR